MAGSAITRRERERHRHRGEVLLAAEELFSRRGYHETSVQDIARRAEFAVGTLYNMFESKAAIYHELIRIRAAEYMDRIKGELKHINDPVEQLEKILWAKFEFFNSHRQFFTIFSRILWESPSNDYFTEEGRKTYTEYVSLLNDVFRAGVSSGRFVDADPRLLTLFFEGITRMILAGNWPGPGDGPADPDVEEIKRMIFRGVLA